MNIQKLYEHIFQHDVMENSKAMELWNIILRQFRNGTSSNMIEHNGPVPGFDTQPNEGFLKCGYPLIIHFIWICRKINHPFGISPFMENSKCQKAARSGGVCRICILRAPLGDPVPSRSEKVSYWKVEQELLSRTTFQRLERMTLYAIFAQHERNVNVIWTQSSHKDVKKKLLSETIKISEKTAFVDLDKKGCPRGAPYMHMYL